MKLKQYPAMIILILIYFTIGLSSVSAQDKDLVSLLDKITARIDSYPENLNWKAMCVSKQTEMNKQWQPEKTTTVKSIEKNINNESSNEILEAIETENGKSKDITAKMAKQAEAQREKGKKDAAKGKGKKEPESIYSAFFPFTKETRAKYNFKKLDDSVFEGTPVFLIEAKAKEKDENLLEGKYYIDQKNYDVLKMQVKPSDLPKIVDEMEMEMNFKMLPEGLLVMKSMKMRGSGGLLVMHFRMIAEQEYSNYEILSPGAK
jgi:hypothetical protein